MIYAISIWNFIDENNDIISMIKYFYKNGYNAISFKPDNIVNASDVKLEEVITFIKSNSMQVTIHANYDTQIEQLEYIINKFNYSINCISIDPKCKIDPNAVFFKKLNVMPLLEYLEMKSMKYDFLFGLEDFPLDDNALDNNKIYLSNILNCPRYGILVDVGHSNLRIHDNVYFKNKGLEKYFKDIPLKIIELHVHDNDTTADKHMPPGKGTLDYKIVSKVLKEKKFNNISTIEISPRLYNSVPDNEKISAIDGLNYWRKYIES